MNETLLILIEESAVAARSASDIAPAMPFSTVESDEGLDSQAEEIGDLFDFLRLQKNASFSITALSAFFALKNFHKIFLALFERFYTTPLCGSPKPRRRRGVL
jgi:hypothetical protein